MTLEFPEIIEPPVAEAEPATSPAAVAIVETAAGLDLSKLDLSKVALAGFAESEEQLKTAETALKNVQHDLSTSTKLKDAISLRNRLVKAPRTQIGKLGDAIRGRMRQVGKDVTAHEEKLAAEFDRVETYITPQIETRQAEIAAEETREADRKAAHEAGIVRIRSYLDMAQGLPSERIASGVAVLEAMTFGPEWEEFAVPAANAQCQTIEALRMLLSTTQAKEVAEAETRRQAEVQHVLSSLTWHVTKSFGKPASHVQEIIGLLNATVYSESLGPEVLTAHDAAASQLRTLHAIAVQQEALAAQAAAQAAQVTAPAAEPQSGDCKNLWPAPSTQNTQSEKQDGSLPAAAGACARTEAEAAETSGGDEGTAAHAEERAAEPVFIVGAGPALETSEADAIEPALAPIDTRPPIKLGDINARIAPLQISADGLAQLGFVHTATESAAKLYHASDFPAICRAAAKHFLALAERTEA